MELPIIDQKFIETPAAKKGEVFHSFSKGICPTCRQLVDGVRMIRNNKDYLRKTSPREEFARIIGGLIAKEGTLDTTNISVAEPTIHPQFLEFCDMAKRPQIARLSFSPNGLRIASDPDFCRELARRHVYVNLQLDA